MSIATCFLGGGGVVVANNLALYAFDRSYARTIVILKSEIHTLKCKSAKKTAFSLGQLIVRV